jgi:hypothetical protein
LYQVAVVVVQDMLEEEELAVFCTLLPYLYLHQELTTQ